MRALLPLGALVALGACAQLAGVLGPLGVGSATSAACAELVRTQINDPDRASLVERLKGAGVMCLVAVANDVLTVEAVDAPTPELAGDIVAETAEAAAAVEGESAVLAAE